MATAPRTPQDHRPKAVDVEPFTFEATDADGEAATFTLPPASIGRKALPGRAFRDGAMGGEMGQIVYMFQVLEASGAEKDAMEALYDMPQDEMMDVLNDWGNYGDGDGASVPQS